MKKYFSLVIAFVAMLFAGNSFAYTPPPAPAQGWYVSDQTGKLTPAELASLNQKIEQVSKTTKNEFGILFLNDMGGDNIEDVAYTTFNSWGIGKRGLDNGVLIVVSLQERKSRIETGKGVGGEVTDVQALNILKTNLNPFLKKGDFAGGFHSTLDALSSLIESRHNQKPLVVSNAPPSTAGCAIAAAGVGADSSGGGGVLFILFLLVGVFVVAMLARRSSIRKQEAIAKAERDLENRRRAARYESERRQKELERTQMAASGRLGAQPIPPAPRASTIVPPPVPRPTPSVAKSVVTGGIAGVTAGVLAAEAAKRQKDREESNRLSEETRRRQQDEENRRRRQREQDEEDRRRRQREDDDRRSSYSSSSSYDSGSSSSGGGYDGGSSGGGGASSDW